MDSFSVPEEIVQPKLIGHSMLFVRLTGEPLRDLSKCKNESQSKGYGTLADNLISLDDLNSLPLSINISLDDGRGTKESFAFHNVSGKKHATSSATRQKFIEFAQYFLT